MPGLKEKAAHCECTAEFKKQFSPTCIATSEDERKARVANIAKTLADYVQVFKPRLILVADEEVFAARPLERLREWFLQAKADATAEEVCRRVTPDADGVRGIILAEPTGWDADELARPSERAVLTLGGAQ